MNSIGACTSGCRLRCTRQAWATCFRRSRSSGDKVFATSTGHGDPHRSAPIRRVGCVTISLVTWTRTPFRSTLCRCEKMAMVVTTQVASAVATRSVGREGGTLAAVVFRRVGQQLVAAGAVRGAAMQAAFVDDVNLNTHNARWFAVERSHPGHLGRPHERRMTRP